MPFAPPRPGAEQDSGIGSRLVDQAGRHGDRREEHGREHESTAQEDRREQTILRQSDPGPNDTDEPQERDSGERNEIQREQDEVATGGIEDPLPAVPWERRNDQPDAHHGEGAQHGEDNPGERGRSLSPKRRPH